MSVDKLILIIFGVLLIVGGFFGFIKAGSKISLMMGLVSGALIFLGIYLTASNPKIGYSIISSTSLILTIVFVMRFAATQKFMPSGMLILASVVALIVSISRLLQK